MPLRKSSPDKGTPLLIAAVSGRALATAARRAGFRPLVADFFADSDTAALSGLCIKMPGDIGDGFRWGSLYPALAELDARAPSPPLGLVYGAGFEDRPALLSRIAGHFQVLGNDPGTVALVKDPQIFFGRLARLGIPHPETSFAAPTSSAGWLAKRQGGAGGSHIVSGRGAIKALTRDWWDTAETSRHRVYFQRRIAGRPVSVLFVANGVSARMLGFSEQWTAPRRGAKWRYGGAAQPAELTETLPAELGRITESVAASFKLKGLGSADFLIARDKVMLLEINPRPGATLDNFDDESEPLLHLHLDAILKGRLPRAPLPFTYARAAAIVYAPRRFVVPERLKWPSWTADRPRSGERIDKDRPICTVLARADSLTEAKRLVQERLEVISALCMGQNVFP